MRYLLDVNVWIALLDEAHLHHAAALSFIQTEQLRIASCPLVENAVLRILNFPGYSQMGPVGFEPIRRKLREIWTELDHEFWEDDISLVRDDCIDWSRVLGHNQITDIYLLALAVKHKGCLVTLDHRVALSTVLHAKTANLRRL